MRHPIQLLSIAGLLLASLPEPANGKDYNRRQDISPELQSTLQRTLAKSRNQRVDDTDDAIVITDDVVNTSCGKLEIGNVEGDRIERVDRDIIITGNIINSARNCPRR